MVMRHKGKHGCEKAAGCHSAHDLFPRCLALVHLEGFRVHMEEPDVEDAARREEQDLWREKERREVSVRKF